jgi:hypothetical protein
MDNTSENKDIIRNSIADLLTDNDINLTDDIDAQTLNFNRVPSTVSKKDMMTLEQSREKAKDVMESLLRVYLSDNFISKNEYVKAKVNLDAMTLGNIMNQMEVSQRAIQILMENIELGDINPKLFEVLGKLQGTFIDLVKAQTTYIMNASDEYEKLALDKDSVVDTTSASPASEISSGFKSSSQKDLMRLIRKVSDKEEK